MNRVLNTGAEQNNEMKQDNKIGFFIDLFATNLFRMASSACHTLQAIFAFGLNS